MCSDHNSPMSPRHQNRKDTEREGGGREKETERQRRNRPERIYKEGIPFLFRTDLVIRKIEMVPKEEIIFYSILNSISR